VLVSSMLSFFIFYFILEIHSWQFFMTCGMTCRIDQIKIDVLHKGLNMSGDFGHFF